MKIYQMSFSTGQAFSVSGYQILLFQKRYSNRQRRASSCEIRLSTEQSSSNATSTTWTLEVVAEKYTVLKQEAETVGVRVNVANLMTERIESL